MKCKDIMDAMNTVRIIVDRFGYILGLGAPYIESVSLPIPMIKEFEEKVYWHGGAHEDRVPLKNGDEVGQFYGYKIIANNTTNEFWINFDVKELVSK
jgi:hypothetical protein